MGRFKRFCLIVFGLAGTLCLVALALPWIGPYTREAASLLNNSYYVAFVLGAFVITMIGLLITLLRGLLSPAKRKVVTIDKTGGDKITVTTAAISSQATHVVEDRGRFIAEKVQVETKRGGDVSVHVRVKPRHVVSVVDEGRHLHDELAGGLATICGDKVRHINLEFVEAEAPEPAQDVHIENLEIPASVYERAAKLESAPAGGYGQLTGSVDEAPTSTSDAAADANATEGEEA